MKKFVMLFFMSLLAIIFISCQNVPTEKPTGDNVGSFASYEQLGTYLKQFYETSNNKWYAFNSALEGSPEMVFDESVDYSGSGSEDRNYSKTNNQVDGVNEADTILTDGYYIYIVSGEKFFMIDAETLDIHYEYNFGENSYIEGLYVEGDKIVLIGNYYFYEMIESPYTDPDEDDGDTQESKDTEPVVIVDSYYPYYRYDYGTKIVVLDKSDLENIEVYRELKFDSAYIASSRMIDDRVYLILNDYSISYYFEAEGFVPEYMDSVISDDLEMLGIDNIYFMPNDSESFSYLILVSFSVDDLEEASVKAYLGSTYQIYMSVNNLYTTVYNYSYNEEEETYEQKTFILRFEISDDELVYKALGEIQGMPLNQFSMDEYDGVFRIAVTYYNYKSQDTYLTNTLYLLNAESENEMTEISKLGGLGKPNERIYSVRYNEEIAYVVTFVNTDPLYKLDLSDANNPVILGELYEEGVSDYLHQINDDLMIGVGRMAETNENGWSNFIGVKVALYDTSGDTPISTDTYLVEGEYSYTSVTYNHKAFIYYEVEDEDFVYIAIPVSIYEDSYYRYSQKMFVFKVYFSGELELVDELEHENSKNNYFDTIEKAVMIENYIYTLSYSQIQVFNMNDDFSFIDKLIFNNQYYNDYSLTEDPEVGLID
jgi:uncharacterized secreted protein with C-terminal beta-propeller domain